MCDDAASIGPSPAGPDVGIVADHNRPADTTKAQDASHIRKAALAHAVRLAITSASAQEVTQYPTAAFPINTSLSSQLQIELHQRSLQQFTPHTSHHRMAQIEVEDLYAELPRLPQDDTELVATLSSQELREWSSQQTRTEQSEYALSYRFLYNSTFPINRLPTELLANIVFLWTFSGSDLTKEPSYDWMAHMGVCRHWRGIALSTALLWTKISTKIARNQFRTFVTRAGTCMIDLYLHGTVSRPHSIGSNASSEIGTVMRKVVNSRSYAERIRSLDIVLGDYTHVATFMDYWFRISMMCTNITALQLLCRDTTSKPGVDISAFPHLRSLACSAQFQMLIPPHRSAPIPLTSLTVAPSTHGQVAASLLFLYYMSYLEFLYISFPRGDDTIQEADLFSSLRSASPRDDLPSLRLLDLRGSQYALIVDALSRVRELNASISITDSCSDGDDPSAPIMQVFPSLVQACRKALAVHPGPGTLSIEETCGATYCVISGEDEQRWSVKMQFSRKSREDGNASAIIPDIVREFRHLRFKTLHIRQNDESSWREHLDWLATFAALPFIENLKVTSDKAVDALWEALGQQDGTAELTAPILTSIQCQLKHQKRSASDLENTLSLMVECLAYRKQHGAGVQSLVFEGTVESLSQATKDSHEVVRERLASLVESPSFDVLEGQ
ncbi:hypothetical protein CERSUDRAFT_92087 [Gelatoporia subvermispora B]|uniref:Uncharacterized protein n=1 Tax=Ceriporiopsis subvermispora (strain B) TaxID=914234 RepID=M2PSF1_CERS8|nr:hypothetical protein CERSUDRAFT_92087 [Gelatoporia subvermispora B]